MFWNKRSVRLIVGFLLLGLGILNLLPSLTGFTSLDGTVNARFTVLTAPIEGTIQNSPPRVGTPLRAGHLLLAIGNQRVNRAVAASLSAELETTRERLKALDLQRRRLGSLRDELAARLAAYQHASIRSLEQEIAATSQRVAINKAQQRATSAELERRSTLGMTGYVAGSQVEQARAAQATSSGEGLVAAAQARRLEEQLDALRKGVYLGDGRNDVPYSRQRHDDVTIQIADLDTRLRENEARAAQIEKQLAEEEDRVRRLESANIRMPFPGVIWRNAVVSGSNVVVGNELLRVLDCRDLFVDILVSEVDYDEIFPGRKARIRLVGRADTLAGEVMSVRGSQAVVEEVILAATPPKSQGRNARIRVSIEGSELNDDYANFCQVGRTVQVRFESRTLPLERWIKAIWFSIT